MPKSAMLRLHSATDWLGEYRARGADGMTECEYRERLAAQLLKCIEAAQERLIELEAPGFGRGRRSLERRVALWRSELAELRARAGSP